MGLIQLGYYLEMKTRLGHMALTLLPFFLTYLSSTDATLAAMSVDFGSQYMKMALVKPGVPMEIVLNKESRRKTPNLIAIRDGERFFGDAALAASVKYPRHSIGYLLDLLGKKIDNPIVSLYTKRFPFLNITTDDERQTVHFDIDGEKYSVESLIAMLLSYARKTTEDFAEQPVRDVVITVPAFFNQAERRAMVKAAEMADLNLLQLFNDHSAAGLNYGVFRRKEIGDQARILLIYDMGATKTTAAIISYQFEKEKDSNEKNPTMRTIGYGFDRTLGGLEITLRLRDHLVEEFRRHVKTQQDIAENPRSMAKMLKEAERLKQVLSANADHFAQVENVHEDHDFKVRVTRAELEEMIADLEPRMLQPINDALKMAEMDVAQVDQVVLMGAGTRVPKVKAVLQGFFRNKELSNFLNTDEAIAMGSVYQAAHLSKGFKVKKFGVYDLHIFPIQVDFWSASEKNGVKTNRLVHRPIFSHLSFYPSNRKILSFTSFDDDFGFNLNYGDLKQLSDKQMREFGSVNISDIEMSGIAEAMRSEMADEGTSMKGVKVRFSVDGSGVVHLEGAEAVFDKLPKEQSAFASIAGKFAGLFSSGSGSKEEAEKAKGEADKESDERKGTESKEQTNEEEQSKDPKSNANQADAGSEKNEKPTTENEKNRAKSGADEKEKETAKEQKPKTVKIPLKVSEKRLDLVELSAKEMAAAKKILSSFEDRERTKAKREAAHNNFEALVYDVTDKLEQSEFQKFMTEEEREGISEQVKVLRIWLEDEADVETTTEQFENKHNSLEILLKPIKFRIKEFQERPAVVADLLSLFNHTETFLALSENFTAIELFTEVEIATLKRVFNETKVWWAEKNASQLALKPTDPPAYTVNDLREKIRHLDREVKYLLNKMRFAKPKLRKEEAKRNATNETESDSATGAEDTEEGSPQEAVVAEKGSAKEMEDTEVSGLDEKSDKESPGMEKTDGSEDLPASDGKNHDASEL
uniref:Hypoxia up-regulated protein 1 n=2 Tax=Parascaris univalens TaxID=6257 RepID=A0A915BBA6_PARUN